jgi:hypothetical protein
MPANFCTHSKSSLRSAEKKQWGQRQTQRQRAADTEEITAHVEAGFKANRKEACVENFSMKESNSFTVEYVIHPTTAKQRLVHQHSNTHATSSQHHLTNTNRHLNTDYLVKRLESGRLDSTLLLSFILCSSVEIRRRRRPLICLSISTCKGPICMRQDMPKHNHDVRWHLVA